MDAPSIVQEPIESKSLSLSANQRLRIINGFCLRCGAPRNTDGSKTMCRPCAKRISALTRRITLVHVKFGRCTECKQQRLPTETGEQCKACRKKRAKNLRSR